MDIDIELRNLDLALNTFNNNILSEELDNYIINSLLYKSLGKDSIKLYIKGIAKKEEQEKLTKVIHKQYTLKYKELKKIDKVDDYIRICLFIIGVVAILIHKQLISFLSEVFLIAGWVIIWEIVYDILFRTVKRKKKISIYNKLANAKIEFI